LDCQSAMRDDKSANHRCILTLLGVAMRNFDAIIPILKMLGDRVRNEYRPMPPARAANGDGDVGFAFLLILRKKKVDEAINVIEKLYSRFMRVHVLDDGRIGARIRFQIRNKIRIRQESDVE